MRIAALILLAMLAGCARSSKPESSQGYVLGPMSHVVVCWLKEPGNGQHVVALVKASEDFRDFPGVVSVHAGRQYVVGPTTRPIDDTSFDVLIVMTFESPKALRDYQEDPRHKQAVRDVLQPLTRKVVVYDAYNPNESLVRMTIPAK